MALLSFYRNKNIRVDWETRKKYLKAIWWFRRQEGIQYFVEGIIGLRLAPHQRICLKNWWIHPTSGGILSRGMAKTTMEAITHASRTMLYHSYRIQSVAGGSFKQTKQVMQYSEQIIKGDLVGQIRKEYIKKCLPRHDKIIVKSSNYDCDINISSSTIKGLAMNGDNRGFRANTLTVGEANDVPAEIMNAIFKPFMAVPYDPMGVFKSKTRLQTILPKLEDKATKQNFFMQTGTINYDWTPFWHWCKGLIGKITDYVNTWIKRENIHRLVTEGDTDIYFGMYDFEDTYVGEKGLWRDINKKGWNNPKIERQYIKMDLAVILSDIDNANTDMDTWKAEYKNIIISSSGREFSMELLHNAYKDRSGLDVRAVPRLRSDKMCVWGIDPARSANNAEFSIVIGELGESYNQLVYCFGDRNMSFGDMTEKILMLDKCFPNTILIGIDQGGGGTAIRDNLRDRRFIPVSKAFLIDPDDPDNLPMIESGSDLYRSIIRMLSPTAERNTYWNKFAKNQLELHNMIIPFTTDGKYLFDEDTLPKEYFNGSEVKSEIVGLYRAIHVMKKQIASVEIQKAGNFLSYFVKNGQKDRYSAFVYMNAMVQLYMQVLRNKVEVEEEAYGAVVRR